MFSHSFSSSLFPTPFHSIYLLFIILFFFHYQSMFFYVLHPYFLLHTFVFNSHPLLTFILSFLLLLLQPQPLYFFFPLSSLRVDEPGDPCSGHLHGLCSRKCPAVSDRRNAHPPPLHPEKRGWCSSHRLPAQP